MSNNASKKKNAPAPSPSRPKSRTKEVKKPAPKGGKTPVKPVVKTVELLSEKVLPEPDCTFAKWDLTVVNQMIENDMNNWQNSLNESEAPPEPVVPKKVAPTPSNKNKKVDSTNVTPVDQAKPITPAEPENNEPDLKQFQPYLKEWKSLLKKNKPHVVRKGFPSHPYFEELRRKRLSSTPTEEKKPVKAKPKTPVKPRKSVISTTGKFEDLMEPEEPAPTEDLSINVPTDKEVEEQMVEDFNKYCEFVPLTDKGTWNEAFLSAVSLISHYRNNIDLGGYLWERIYPKQENDYLPRVSQFGKYYVKIYFMGEERIVVIDDKLPQDRNGKILFCITQKKEYWSALLMKALMKVAKG
jgi:hypothetical protein